MAQRFRRIIALIGFLIIIINSDNLFDVIYKNELDNFTIVSLILIHIVLMVMPVLLFFGKVSAPKVAYLYIVKSILIQSSLLIYNYGTEIYFYVYFGYREGFTVGVLRAYDAIFFNLRFFYDIDRFSIGFDLVFLSLGLVLLYGDRERIQNKVKDVLEIK